MGVHSASSKTHCAFTCAPPIGFLKEQTRNLPWQQAFAAVGVDLRSEHYVSEFPGGPARNREPIDKL